ncbi:MAG: hypothetical protein O2979_00630 [Proteobacteria bacterium]|nr:hypothetical protein [Pseudomonadota bacterium]
MVPVESRGMLAQSWGWAWGFQAGMLLALAAACTTAPPPAPAPVLVPGRAAPVPPPADAVRYSAATSLPEYQREMAGLLHAASADRVYVGAPPNPLRAVVVYYAEIDALGETRMLLLFRAPEHAPELAAYAAESLRLASPFPRPRPQLMNGAGRIVITETWLFDREGRFRLRTLSLPQARPPQWDEEFP